MSISTAWDEDARRRMYQLAADYKSIIDRMVNGETVPDAPWLDPRFQGMVNSELGMHGMWRLAAEKLAVVKEVFGGE